MSITTIVRHLPPHLRRKVEKVAELKKLTFVEALIFCLKR